MDGFVPDAPSPALVQQHVIQRVAAALRGFYGDGDVLLQRQLGSRRIICMRKQEFKHLDVLIPARFSDAQHDQVLSN
jgi:hypothetical protein